jgi:hypothetical protein
MPPHHPVAKLKILICGPGNQDNAGLECDRTPVCYDRKSRSSTNAVALLKGCFVCGDRLNGSKFQSTICSLKADGGQSPKRYYAVPAVE